MQIFAFRVAARKIFCRIVKLIALLPPVGMYFNFLFCVCICVCLVLFVAFSQGIAEILELVSVFLLSWTIVIVLKRRKSRLVTITTKWRAKNILF